MSAILRFGTDGWRARLDGDFTNENVIRVADAAGALWAQQATGSLVYVGFDTRPGAKDFARLAAKVLAAHGLVVKVSDRYVPTPALAWTVAQDARAVGGLMVTGSHNPNDYQGIKLRMADGGVGSEEFYEELQRTIEPDPTSDRGPIQETDFLTPYFDHLYTMVDAERINAAHLKLVYDPLYGSASGYFADLLRAMGIDVTEIHGTVDEETDAMHPEPIEPWVDDCERAVVERGACAGLVNDGDGDRVGAVDEHGRFVNSQKVIAIILGHLCKNRGWSGRVVLNLSSSILTRRVAKELGCRLSIKPVGFKHIYSEMKKHDVLLGGGEAGGIGIACHMPERDGILTNLLLCEAMAETGKTPGELVEELEDRCGRYHYARRDLRVDPEVIEMFRTILPGLNPPVVAGRVPVAVSHMDGLRLEFADESWLLLRPSGTEPVVRVYAEASTIELRDELLEAGTDLAHGEFS
ncbi:MAG: phosphoglucomutase/phosphomannomutase family protein [Collinsella sp.]|nr:phosphoglucomutase/phosphomannomutase family protein [Collinsella sp.]